MYSLYSNDNRLNISERSLLKVKKSTSGDLTFVMIKLQNFEYLENYYKMKDFHTIFKMFMKRLKTYKDFFLDSFSIDNSKHVLVLNDSKSLDVIDSLVYNTLSQPYVKGSVASQLQLKLSSYIAKDKNISFKEIITYLNRALIEPNYNKYANISEYTTKHEKVLVAKNSMVNLLVDIINGTSKSSIIIEYDPIINIENNRVSAFEALSRIDSTDYGMVFPKDFIALAESNGLINGLTPHILKTAFSGYGDLKKKYSQIRLNINASPYELLDSSYVDILEYYRDKYSLTPMEIGIEITETMLFENRKAILQTISRLSDLGYRIILDDFGAGFSSLSYLIELPLSEVKIDRKFISQAAVNKDYEVFLTGVVFTIRSLNYSVVAEGVETIEQRDLIERVGAQEAQGFFFSKPQTQ